MSCVWEILDKFCLKNDKQIQRFILVSCHVSVTFLSLTYNDECIVDVHAAEAVGSLTDVSSRIVSLHLFNS